MYISPHGGTNFSFRPEYGNRYGTACAGITQNGNLYMRRFSGGFAVVNATLRRGVVQLPSNHTYSDMEGRPISNPLTVAPIDAYMLLTSGGNGCS